MSAVVQRVQFCVDAKEEQYAMSNTHRMVMPSNEAVRMIKGSPPVRSTLDTPCRYAVLTVPQHNPHRACIVFSDIIFMIAKHINTSIII